MLAKVPTEDFLGKSSVYTSVPKEMECSAVAGIVVWVATAVAVGLCAVIFTQSETEQWLEEQKRRGRVKAERRGRRRDKNRRKGAARPGPRNSRQRRKNRKAVEVFLPSDLARIVDSYTSEPNKKNLFVIN